MKYFFILLFFFPSLVQAQYNGRQFSFGVNLVYTTDAQLYLNPNSSIVVERNNSFPLTDIINPGVNLRYKLLDQLMLDLNVEYMVSTAKGNNERVIVNNSIQFINVEDGFKLIPIELSIYYLLPFSTEKFKFLMGGGGGYYIGSMIRKFGNAEVSTSGRKAAYGIQVAIEMDYMIKENLSLKTEMKFRDPQFIVTNRYSEPEYTYNGRSVIVTREEFETKINVDGIAFVLGLAYHF